VEAGRVTVPVAAPGRRALIVAVLRAAAAACLLSILACGPAPDGGGAPAAGRSVGFRFVDVAEAAGLDRVTLAGRPSKDHLLDSTGTGVAWLDYDRDGWIDAYVVNGWRLDGARVVERGENALYRNRGDGTFEDVTRIARVGGEGRWGSGVAVADYDDDGWPDLFVTCFGPNVLYRNRGDGTFENVAARAGIEAPGWNTGAAFFDADGDGRLDLYVAAYVDHDLDDVLAAERTLDWKGVDRVALGPFGLPGARDRFFRARDDGTFEDATEQAGLEDKGLGFGFMVRAADLDRDGDVDLYVANDSDANYFYRNEGDGTLREIGLWSGAALDQGGAAQASMGVTIGDANADAQPDLFVTNFSEDFSTLYVNDGHGFFEDVSRDSGLGEATYPFLKWGAAFADLDNDGDQDLVQANGHIYPQVDAHPELGLTYEQTNQLLANVGGGKFVDVSAAAGPAFAERAASRGLAAGDYDNDGDLDLLLSRLDRRPALLRNDSANGHWLAVQLEPARPGSGTVIGTEVTLRVAGKPMWRDLSSGDSFLSAHDPRLHFGLGDAAIVERVEVRWPDGRKTVLENVATDRLLVVTRPE
jgi:hypothetical protein